MIEHLKYEDMIGAKEFAESIHRDSIWGYMPFDYECWDKYCKSLIDNPKNGFILVYKVDKEIVGTIVAGIQQFPFNQETFSSVYIFYIKKDHRGSKIVVDLIDRYIEEAKKYNVREIHIGTNAPTDREKVEKLYEWYGFTNSGSDWTFTQ